jgi:hypothetical protein
MGLRQMKFKATIIAVLAAITVARLKPLTRLGCLARSPTGWELRSLECE